MRRIYKTTTAIVACLALVAPQIAVAQDQQDGGMPETSILPQEAQEQLATEQATDASNKARFQAEHAELASLLIKLKEFSHD